MPRGAVFVCLLATVAVALLATLAAAFVLPAPWSWLVGWTWLAWDTWLGLRLTLLAAGAVRAPAPAAPGGARPTLTVLIAARDEAAVLPATLAALDAQDEPAETVIVIDDGSRDGTATWLATQGVTFAADGWGVARTRPALRALTKANSGKADSLNQALARADTDLVVTLDADTLAEPGALRAVRDAFAADPALVAAGAVLVPTCRGGWGRIFAFYQRLEYLRSFLWRAAWTRAGTLVLVSGAFAAFRRERLTAVGGFDPRSRVEDYELLFRLHRAAAGGSLRVAVLPRAVATTDAPATPRAFVRQRTRWFAGFLETMLRHRDLVGDRRVGALGTRHLPVKTGDMLLPLYGLAALAALIVFLLRDGAVHPLILVALGGKIVLDALLAAVGVALTRRWRGSAPLAPLPAALAALTEPFGFQLLRQLGAASGWLALLRRRIEWAPRAAVRAAAALAFATAAGAAELDAAHALRREGRLAEAEAAYAAVVAVHPADVEALAGLATVQGWRGDHAAAIATWRSARALAPDDARLRLGLARVLSWAGLGDEAEAELAPLLAAGGDHDAWLAAGDIAHAAGRSARARERWHRALARDPASGEARERLARNRPLRFRLDLGGARERFAGSPRDDAAQWIVLGMRLADGVAVAAGLDREHRPLVRDDRAAIEAWIERIPRLAIHLRVARTLDRAEALPGREADADLALRLAAPVDLLAGARWRDYDDELWIWRPGLRVRPGLGLVVEGRWNRTTGGERTLDAIEGRVAYEAGRWTPYVAAARGEDIEPPAAAYRVTTLAAGALWTPAPDFGLRADVAREEREGQSLGVRVGVGSFVRF